MQPFVNPNYFGYNNYLTSVPQANSYMPVQNAMGISGKFVNSFDEITVNDVPMDGRISIFPKNDESEIEVRKWSPNGQIVKTLYKAQICKNDEKMDILSNESEKLKFDAKSEVLDPLFERIEQLENKIDRLSRNQRPKKEVSADES